MYMKIVVANSRDSRRGLLTLSVLVTLAIVATLSIAWVRTLVLERQQTADEIDRVQAEFITQSALARAATRLLADPAYPGESWRIERSAQQLPLGAVATIEVKPIEGRDSTRRITVETEYPTRGAHLVRQRQEKTITLSREGDAS